MKAKDGCIVFSIVLIAYVAAISMPLKACYPPQIEILSPKNTVYPTNSVPLTFTISQESSWIGYSLDGQANVTILGNTTLTALQDGTHYVVVYANGTYGKIGASDSVCFSVDTKPPNITDVCQNPDRDSVFPEDEVKVNATVTDDVSGVKQVTLFYAYANRTGIWIAVARNMTKTEADTWTATIPKFAYGTNVAYAISAEDNVGNSITTVEMGYDIQYQVIPETSSTLVLPLLMMATLLAVIVSRKKHPSFYRMEE